MTADQVAVLHYVYNRFEDLNSRRDRCDCAPTEEDVKRCFILAFDREVRTSLCFSSSASWSIISQSSIKHTQSTALARWTASARKI